MPRWPKMRSFIDARKFVRKLKIRKFSDWRQYSKSGMRPKDIPAYPMSTYADKWISYQDYFGPQYKTRNFSNENKERCNLYLRPRWLPYKEARKWARRLRFTSSEEWFTNMSRKKRPYNIPFHPGKIYWHHGWNGWDDWLGYRGRKKRHKKFLSFKDARKYVQALRLPSICSWKRYSSSDKRPDNIPSNPERTYEKEWTNWTDWLGSTIEISKKRFRNKYWLPFEEARKWAISLKLKSTTEWQMLRKTDLPEGVPTNPHKVYRDEWRGWRYWIGKEELQKKT